AIAAALFRRLVVKPRFIDYRSVDAFRILGLIASVMFTYFLAMGAAIRAHHPDVADITDWMPVSRIVAHVYDGGFSEETSAAVFYEIFWWAHAAVLMAFLNYIPHSKHVHLIGALPNIYLSEREKPKGALATIDFERSETFGVGKIFDFNWKQLL